MPTIIASLLAVLMVLSILALGVDNLNAMSQCMAKVSSSTCNYLLR